MTTSKRYLTNNGYDEYRKLTGKIREFRKLECDLGDLAAALFQCCDLVDFKVDDDGDKLRWKHHTDTAKLRRNDALHAELSGYPHVMFMLRGYFMREHETGPDGPASFSQFPSLTRVWINFLSKNPIDSGYFTKEYSSWINGFVNSEPLENH